jgi:hypothetical protein
VLTTRQQREKLVLDLIEQNKNTREIAQIVGISFRDIGNIRRNAGKMKEAEEEQTRQQFLSSRAYELFSKGEDLVQVAIELNIRQPEVEQFYVEYLKMTQLYDLSRICKEIKGDIGLFVTLFRSTQAAGYRAENVVRLLKLANNDLPRLENEYERLREGVNSLYEQKLDLDRMIVNLNNQKTELANCVGHYQASCRREKKKLKGLRQLTIQFENNNHIGDTVKEKVNAILSARKRLLEFAALSVIESIRKNPEKYASLIQQNTSSTTSPDFNPFHMYGQQQHIQSKVYFTEGDVTMLSEDSDRLFQELVTKLGEEVISDYTVDTSFSPSLPAFLPSKQGSITDGVGAEQNTE